ncbi:unnamed protein product [Aphanomyces euteiches]|uniref:BZIP domain-containing protein n=1 Tax=Aphanomyces euteiches TaxID=100861 RepID=A0A6G0WPT4_9STRA|nr:hypothetical protein Ae201684_012892 [Aphanomyces euteiches]
MSGRKAQSRVEAKRRSETLRKRKYRAAKRHEVNQLTLETHCLEQTLAALNAEFASEDKATTNAMEENTTLRKQVNRRQKLVRILSDWVNLHQRPQKALANSSSWGWTVYEAMTPDITLVHNLFMQYTPITASCKVIPLEMIGRLFGRSPDGIQHRETYIAQIQTAAEAAFIDINKVIIRDLSARMDKTSP